MCSGINHKMRTRFWCAVSATAILLWGSASANDQVTIEITGMIEVECGISDMPPTVNLGDLTAVGSRTIPFRVHCNTPFAYSLQSREGGLRHASAQHAGAGFLLLLPYSVDIRIPTNAGTIVNQCASQSLAADAPGCTFSNSGNGVAIQQNSSLTISWSISGKPVAGSYMDVLTLEMRPQL